MFNSIEPKIMMHSFRAGDGAFGFGNIQSSSCKAFLSSGEYSSGCGQCLSWWFFFSWYTMAEHLLFVLENTFPIYVVRPSIRFWSCGVCGQLEWVHAGRSVMSSFLWPMGCSPTRLLCPWDSPGQNTGVGSHPLLQGVFPTQGLNPGLLHWQSDSLPCEPPGKPCGQLRRADFIVPNCAFHGGITQAAGNQASWACLYWRNWQIFHIKVVSAPSKLVVQH